MPSVIIADTSTLIIFTKIDELLLIKKVYSEILITPEIASEFEEELPEWIIIKNVSDKKYQRLLETQVDLGEASAIALAQETEDSLLILDDLKARKLAIKLNLKVTGALGVIHKAKIVGAIPKVKPLIEKLLKTNFRISETIINEILKINNEL